MGIIPSRNLEEQRREKDGIVYFDRGVIEGKDGRKYQRYAIQTHFVQVGESQKELVENTCGLCIRRATFSASAPRSCACASSPSRPAIR